jgi:solute:Na+ symporter, SSS family
MKLSGFDIVIIFLYLIAIVVIGFIMKKRAEKDKGSYLLGGNTLPWYMLGLSNASGMFDISGTMWLVTAAFVYGVKSVWLPWMWPVFNQIFLMVFLSKWLRRSNATTGAEWITTRFGNDTGAKLSHGIVVIFALFNCLGFLAYGFIGVGKFMEIFIPWEYVNQFLQLDINPKIVPHLYGIVFTIFAMIYAILGGMSSIVWADVLQYVIMTVAAIVIGVIAMVKLGDHALNVPDGWMNPFFGKNLNMDWSNIIADVNVKIKEDGYTLFSAIFMMMLFKGALVSLAGPAPTYDMQKILATKNPKEASKMSGFVSVILMPVRYLMIAGFAVLGLLFYDQLDLMVAGKVDFEQILPSAINEFVPVGLLGLLLAGLLAAFNSTFAGTLNAAQAYVTNDLYLKYTNPKASNVQIKWSNYIVGIVTVIVSVVLGMFAKNVNQLLQLIVSVLWASYVASNVLKWYWWRFNSHGYFWGMLSGIAASIIPVIITSFFWENQLASRFENISQDIFYLYFFPVSFVLSLIGSVVGTLLTQPTDEETLKSFYKNVKPWGFWKPVKQKVMAENPNLVIKKEFGWDMLNVSLGIIAQTALVILPIYIVVKQMLPMWITIAVILVCGVVMKKTWWDRLED